jgi:Thiamine biosynthesis enzyme ThiH and related uncharacterized enzymes
MFETFKVLGLPWAKKSASSVFFGANDLGSTMLEENVVAAVGCVNQMAEKDMIRLINGAGFVPKKRDTFYSYQGGDNVN